MIVCLFDIDGTLLSSGGAGQAAMEHALERVFGITGPTEGIGYAGRTDRAITTDMLRYHGVAPTDQVVSTFLNAYLDQLPHELAACPGLILPGVCEVLRRLKESPDFALSLLTGNFQRGAHVKLQHYDLLHYFNGGGFGDHHRDRDDVARAAVDDVRAEYKAHDSLEFRVIGDTPADIQCGRAIGAVTVAVATGVYSAEELKQTAPDFLFEDLSDIEQVLIALA